MKNSIFLFLLLLTAANSYSQDCNLTEDRTDAYGNILRSAEWSHSDYSGSSVNLMLDRTKDSYSFFITIDQSINSAVTFTLDGEVHPIIFYLNNGGTVKAWVSKSAVYKSQTSGGNVSFSEQYKIRNSDMSDFKNATVTAIVFKCNGRSVSSGNTTNEIRFVLSTNEGKTLSNAFRCLQKEAEPAVLKVAPAPRKSSKSANAGSGSSEQEELLRNLIQAVGEGTDGIKQSVDQSGTAQLELNYKMMEKLEDLSAAIEKLNETKKEKEFVPRVFGFGAYFKTNFLFSEINMNYGLAQAQVSKFLSGTSINLSLNAGMRKKVGFRFEITADFLTSFTDYITFSDSIGGRLETFGLSQQVTFMDIGLSPLLMIRRDRVNIYIGFAGSVVRISGIYKQREPDYANDQVDHYKITAARLGGSLGLTLGGEYLITPHIGVRLESGLKYFIIGETVIDNSNYTNDSDAKFERKQNIFGSFARIGGSFYF